MTLQTAAPLARLELAATNRPVEFWLHPVLNGLVTLDAPYQRGAVWTIDQARALIRSLLQGVPIPAIITNNRGVRRTPMIAVVDGKQRVLTIMTWFNDQFAVPASWFEPDWIVRTEVTDDGLYVRFSGLAEDAGRHCRYSWTIPVYEGKFPTIADEAYIFTLVNGGGTPQTDENMTRAAAIASRSAR